MSLDVNLSEPDEFNCELHSCLEEVAKAKEIENFVYHVEYICGKGENFVANIFRVTINDSDNPTDGVSVIVKTLINTIRQELFHELHKREVNVYKNVINKFEAIQYHLCESDRVEFPTCLFSSIERGKEIIILDDLISKQFAILNKQTSRRNLDFNQACDILKVLAKFHGLSYVYEKQNPEEFSVLKSQFQDLIFEDGFLNRSKLRSYVFESFDMSLKVVTDLDAKRNLDKVSKKLLELFRFFMIPGQGSVLCHGDFWMNNMMFKYEDAEPHKICILDFQTMRYANPVTDILYFMYICTDSAFRSEFFEKLQTIYYDSLRSFLYLFDIDVNLIYSEQKFKLDIVQSLPFGLLTALVQLRIVTAVDEEMLKEGATSSQTEHTEVNYELEDFKMLINDVVKESVENGVLDQLMKKLCSW